MDLGVGDAVEIVACGDVGVQRGRVLVPIGMLEGLVGSRGAIHRALSFHGVASMANPRPSFLPSATK